MNTHTARHPQATRGARKRRGAPGDPLARLALYLRLMRMHRPIGSLLLLWPTMWALWMAGKGHPDPFICVVFVLGVFVMRSAGCVINDYADRHIDPHVRRTRERPLASGAVSEREALVLFVVLGLIALGLVLTLNTFAIVLSLAGIALAMSYPFMKRVTHLPQVYLGVAFGWGIPMAFAALTNTLPPLAWLLLTTNVLWSVIYDTMYAMCDREDDLRIGVKSTAVLLGNADRAVIGGMQVVFLAALLLVGHHAGRGLYYDAGVAVAGLMSLYQQYLIRARDPADCLRAFLNNNWLGAAVFAGLVLDYLLHG